MRKAKLPPPAQLREEYGIGELLEDRIDSDAIRQFSRWFSDAQGAGLREPNGMVLATADPAGRPSARVVLLKGIDGRGLTFFTNYQSRKGRELADNPQACLVFYWEALERQVRIEGRVVKVSRAETAAYFRTRPRTSQIGAWVSNQSGVIASRRELLDKAVELQTGFGNEPIPAPRHWGGYRLIPQTIELWQGRPSRLHDRILYTRRGRGWKIQRLAP